MTFKQYLKKAANLGEFWSYLLLGVQALADGERDVSSNDAANVDSTRSMWEVLQDRGVRIGWGRSGTSSGSGELRAVLSSSLIAGKR